MKFTSLTVMLLCTLVSTSVFSSEFKFNNKNLNALMALVCHSNNQNADKNSIFAHKVLIDKIKHGSSEADTSFEISGTCNIEYDKKSKEIISYGEEFLVEFNLKNKSKISGKIGIRDIVIDFQSHKLSRLTIKDPLMLTLKVFNLKQSHWASSDSIINFNPARPFKLSVGRKTAATEDQSQLKFNTKVKSTFFNTWSYTSYGCSSADQFVTEEICSSIVAKTK